nr:cysteine-rich receptor-like protein kinase 2 isoform X1 [Ipomoea batatas]
MKKTNLFVPMTYLPLLLINTLLLLDVSNSVPRSQTVQRICTHQVEHNNATISTLRAGFFIASMENISAEMGSQGWGFSVNGKGPYTNFGLGQCYGDLSLVDCTLCYVEARSVLPLCFPHNGGRVYLDGCFMRNENFDFFQDNIGPEDTYVCGNGTRKDLLFQERTKRAVLQAVSKAYNNNGYARSDEAPVVYVLANCWRTLNGSACRECLENASRSMLKCLPWSEGRALYTGCFMRYSHTNFLNPIPTTKASSRANAVIILVVAACSVIFVVVGLVIGLYVWKQKRVEKKRRGSNDNKKLVKILHDSSLNFKYSTLKKATGSFDDGNKLGQGGYGIVYKGVMEDGREIAVKRLFFNYKYRAADFYNEINIISNIAHKNLVRLLGCNCSGLESLLAWMHFQEGTIEELFDTNLMLHNYHDINVKIEVFRVVHIGLLCIQEEPFHRPSMSEVLQMLVKKEEELPHPSNPPFIDEKTMEFNSYWNSPMYNHEEGEFASNATMSRNHRKMRGDFASNASLIALFYQR